MPNLRVCKVCGETKPFERSTWVWDSVRGCSGQVCKVCRNVRSVELAMANPGRQAAATFKHRMSNPESAKRAAAKYRLVNRDLVNAKTVAWRIAYPEKSRTASKAAYAKNPTKRLAANKEWYSAHPGYASAAARRREFTLIQRTPQWVDEEHAWLIQEAYALMKLRTEVTGIQWHVDHKVPLRGKRVSGLHVIENLRVIPAKLNLTKNNSYTI